MLQEGVDFNIDVNASVFETNIRGELGFSLLFMLDFLPVLVSELYPELMRGSGQGEFVMQCNRTPKHTEKSQTNVTSFLSLHTVLLPVSTQTDIDVAVSIFWCQVLSFGINIFSTETVQIVYYLYLHTVLE